MIKNTRHLSCLWCCKKWPTLFSLLFLTASAFAQDNYTPDSNALDSDATYSHPLATQHPIAIGIIIDDLGNLNQRDTRAVRLPGNVTLSILPQTPYAHELALLAHRLNKEVMLHLPMESMEHNPLGPGGLTLDMSAVQLAQQLQLDLDSIPYVAGVNNHMGSLLTQHPGHMLWLMLELRKHNKLYFVDSYTTKTSIAQQLANENWIPNLRRDVFLDHDRNPDTIRFHFRRLIKKAKQNGTALAIGHPFPETMSILEQELPKLKQQGIALLPVSQLVHQTLEASKLWQAYLSH